MIIKLSGWRMVDAETVLGFLRNKESPCLSSVLHSDRAIRVNIEIMRAFVRLRQLLASHTDLSKRLDELERKYDKQFAVVFDAIRQLMTPPTKPQNEIGYHTLIDRDS